MMVKPLLMVPLESLRIVSGALFVLAHVAAAEFCAHRLTSPGRPCADSLDSPAQSCGGRADGVSELTTELGSRHAPSPAPTTVDHVDEEDAPHSRWPVETKLKPSASDPFEDSHLQLCRLTLGISCNVILLLRKSGVRLPKSSQAQASLTWEMDIETKRDAPRRNIFYWSLLLFLLWRWRMSLSAASPRKFGSLPWLACLWNSYQKRTLQRAYHSEST